jgi:hypothetical protein
MCSVREDPNRCLQALERGGEADGLSAHRLDSICSCWERSSRRGKSLRMRKYVGFWG